MFIATANVVESIPGPLKDRMEILNLSGYSLEEKISISNKHLIPKQIDENGIGNDYINFTNDALETIIKNFTYEAGLRGLERQIGSLCRKVAKRVASGDFKKLVIKSKTALDMLGPPPYSRDEQNDYDEIGVANGLAWTSVGGEVLHIESTQMPGKGLTLTGQLGEVMKESAQAAIGYLRSRSEYYGIDPELFNKREIHLHMPAGAIPKDGPSAGVAMAVAIISSLTGLPVNKDVAMTGEITLTGKVLPIGGLKEKSLAAMRMGLNTVIIPLKNEKDLVEIPKEYRKKINFVPIKSFDDALDVAIIGWKKRAKDLNKNSLNKKSPERPSQKMVA